MSAMSLLETSVLNRIVAAYPDEADAIQEQISSAIVVSRVNTGSGFYTYVSTSSSSTPLIKRAYPGVFATIEGLHNPLSFILFAKDGVITNLEGAAIEDDTNGVDFSRVEFVFI